MTHLDRSRAAAVLAYWFDGVDDATDIRREHPAYRRWFAATPEIDTDVRQRFAADMELARGGACAAWRAPDEILAHVLLLDQVPRHVYRGHARAFASDAAAQELALRCIAARDDERLLLVERVFLYLPLQHSERITDHGAACARFEALAAQGRAAGAGIAGFLDAALRAEYEHIELLRRFGRYPGRNAALGRASTPAELAYLEAS